MALARTKELPDKDPAKTVMEAPLEIAGEMIVLPPMFAGKSGVPAAILKIPNSVDVA
jgi:hypothetical protein